MKKAFLFTIDALLSLLVVSAGLAAFAFLQGSGGADANPLEALGRSYLEQKYFAADAGLTTVQFNQLTGFSASESPPAGAVVARSSLWLYPHVLAGCNCTGAECGLASGANDSCFAGQENTNASLKEVWVKP